MGRSKNGSIRELLPSSSKFLKAADLNDGMEIEVTADRIEMELIGDEEVEKPVLYFAGKEKGLVLNQTNLEVVAIAADDDLDSVAGIVFVLYRCSAKYKGAMVPALRLRSKSVASMEDIDF